MERNQIPRISSHVFDARAAHRGFCFEPPVSFDSDETGPVER
jgi:hypothetical protein